MVPLTIPITEVISSPTSDSRSGRMIGIAPATAASKYRSAPACSAASNNAAPSAASSSLFAVTTEAPCRIAAKINDRAGSIPPMTSITRSTSSRVTSASASVVSNSESMPARSRSGSPYSDADQLQGSAHPSA